MITAKALSTANFRGPGSRAVYLRNTPYNRGSYNNYNTRDTYTQCRASRSEFLRLSVSILVAKIMRIAFRGCLGVSFGKPPRREDLDKAGRDHGDGRSHAGSLQYCRSRPSYTRRRLDFLILAVCYTSARARTFARSARNN